MIPDELKAIPQWVTSVKGSKQPMQALRDVGAAVSRPDTWTSYETAYKAVTNGSRDNVGFVFNNNGIVGIDIDDGWGAEGLMSGKALDIIGRCKSYTEVSRSGRGFHILLYGDLPFNGRNNQDGVEIYKTGRYFIITGHTMLYTKMIADQGAIDYVVEKYFAITDKISANANFTPRVYSPVWDTPSPSSIPLRPHYPPITQGSRNICLTSIAGSMHSIGYTPKQIENELKYVNEVACKPRVSNYEIHTIVSSVTRYRR